MSITQTPATNPMHVAAKAEHGFDVILTYPRNGNTEVHIIGCRSAQKRTDYASPVPLAIEQIIQMQDNPDEGDLKIHACAKPTLKAAQAAVAMTKASK